MNKKEARIIAKANRDNIDKSMHIIKSKIINQKINNDIRFKLAKVIGIYYSFGSEVNLEDLNHEYAIFAYPKIINDKMEFILVNNKTKWIKSNFGVLEPVKGKIVSKDIDLLLISSLARNNNNYRLGYGKGYYDKFIKEYQPKVKIGILFDNYTLDFNEDLWDIALDDFISN